MFNVILNCVEQNAVVPRAGHYRFTIPMSLTNDFKGFIMWCSLIFISAPKCEVQKVKMCAVKLFSKARDMVDVDSMEEWKEECQYV